VSAGVRVEGLDGLEDLLQTAQDTVLDETKPVVKRGAQNIKTDWRTRWHGLDNAPMLEYAVTYDTSVDGTRVSAEIGPDKARRQGALGNLIEYGSVNNAPHPGGSPALDAEEPKFLKALEDMAARLLEGDKPGD
jgi:hypothetical protein